MDNRRFLPYFMPGLRDSNHAPVTPEHNDVFNFRQTPLLNIIPAIRILVTGNTLTSLTVGAFIGNLQSGYNFFMEAPSFVRPLLPSLFVKVEIADDHGLYVEVLKQVIRHGVAVDRCVLAQQGQGGAQFPGMSNADHQSLMFLAASGEYRIETPTGLLYAEVKRSSKQGSDEYQRGSIKLASFRLYRGFFGFSGMTTIQSFLKTCEEQAENEAAQNTTIFRHHSDVWYWSHTIPSQTMASVAMPAEQKHRITELVEKFFRDQTRQYCEQKSLPWRLGMVLHGPAGTGKTSFILALASKQRLPLFFFNLSNCGLNDQSLARLFTCLPEPCILVLEDSDTSVLKQNAEDASKRNVQITHSGVLNVLDGFNASQGRLLIITTNNPDSLDRTITRPGRVDHWFEIGNATAEVATQMFEHTFSEALESSAASTQTSIRLSRMANYFGEAVGPECITPSAIQVYLRRFDTGDSVMRHIAEIGNAKHAIEGIIRGNTANTVYQQTLMVEEAPESSVNVQAESPRKAWMSRMCNRVPFRDRGGWK